MRNSNILCLFIGIAIISLIQATEQKVTVTGQVICDKRSVRNVLIELREHDTFDPDDALSDAHSDKDGLFTVTGSEDEVGKIRPYIRITHNCDVKDRGLCVRKSDYDVPEDKIGEDLVYDMNFVNLNIRGTNDKEICN